ncbi:hypothetical protein EAO71_26510 [Streptomyces sp. ms191]|uniref:DUF6777 domain-containing protein n=1 Tax=Streptomyces sp. ms191 TaxID=1827978 RepID=UPI0011CDE1DF|nr:DUF6777 domain-containing protein [Streptomyces sp. ms191]TXS21828.1 hypothetical protein EAO71_26510 [Streptomyces sp. ms191]
MRASTRRPRRALGAAVAVLASALLVAGCSASGGDGGGGSEQTSAPREVFLQPIAAEGPDPFTASTVNPAAAPPPATVPPDPPASATTAPDLTVREVTGSTPGLYGGTRSVASCDVERQVALLAEDPATSRAFAEAAGIPESRVASWLRGLTPVQLRADTRVTNHGLRDGRATAFQSVLQSGTAVLVDQYGAPRVRCACGNPLRSPVAVQGAVQSGRPWSGYRPDRVVVVRPTTTIVNSLVIVNVVDDTWIERRTGSDGERDHRPAVPPPCDPDTCDPATTPLPDTEPSTRPDGSVTPRESVPPAPSERRPQHDQEALQRVRRWPNPSRTRPRWRTSSRATPERTSRRPSRGDLRRARGRGCA